MATIEAYGLNVGDKFEWQDRVYRVKRVPPTSAENLTVVCVLAKYDGKWVKPQCSGDENFNSYCHVQPVDVQETITVTPR